MKELKATFRIVTPMFIGNAEQHATSIRPPSIKGALRFWWRALNWSCFKNISNTVASALHALNAEEARLFGIAADDKNGGQGLFMVRVSAASGLSWRCAETAQLTSEYEPVIGHTYLLGQALWYMGSRKDGREPQYLRSALLPQEFHVKLIFKPTTDEKSAQSVGNAMRAWGMLGGLGSRSRKGFGSVSIQSMHGFGALPLPLAPIEYQGVLSEMLGELVDDLPPFSAFSKLTTVHQSFDEKVAWSLLGRLGEAQLVYRSYGRKDANSGEYRVGNKKAPQNFEWDHHLMYKVAHNENLQALGGHPQRIIFGLPHNYRFSDRTEATVSAKHFERRASPLIVHLHEFEDGTIWGIQTILQSKFLPSGENIVLSQKVGKKLIERGSCSVQEDYGVLKAYLQDMQGKTLYG